MKKLSTGDDSTLGNYRKLCVIFFGAESPATEFIDKKIEGDPDGANGEVIADERQMVSLLSDINKQLG